MLCHPVPDREETQEGKQMKILVLSCDKYADTFIPFHHCMEKYWEGHPEVIYKTETIDNPFYKTIKANYPIQQWTKGVREVLSQIDDEQILLMMDDCFIRRPVNKARIKYASENLKGNIANINFEKSWDIWDAPTDLVGFRRRCKGRPYEVSIMCGLWDKEKLINVLKKEGSPWDVEWYQNNCGYDFLINDGDFIIDWGYQTWIPSGISRGKWCREVVPFFESEGIEIDLTERGII